DVQEPRHGCDRIDDDQDHAACRTSCPSVRINPNGRRQPVVSPHRATPNRHVAVAAAYERRPCNRLLAARRSACKHLAKRLPGSVRSRAISICTLGPVTGVNTLERKRSGKEGTPVEFVILGRTELRADGRSVDLGATKQRGLLAVLLYHV